MNVLRIKDDTYKLSMHNYFQYLVDHFFKILPMKEQHEDTLDKYLSSLQFELIGFERLFSETNCNSATITLLSILQNMIDNPDEDVSVIRREVFHAISICNKLKSMYCN